MNGWTFENNKIMVDVELVTPKLLLVSVVVKGHLFKGVLLKSTSKASNSNSPHNNQSYQHDSILQTNLHLENDKMLFNIKSNIFEQKPSLQCSLSPQHPKIVQNELQDLTNTKLPSFNPYTSQNMPYSLLPLLSHLNSYEEQVETTVVQTGLEIPSFNNEFSSLYNALDGIEPLFEPIDVPDTNGLEPQPCLIDVDKLIDGIYDDEIEPLPLSALLSDSPIIKLEDSKTQIDEKTFEQTFKSNTVMETTPTNLPNINLNHMMSDQFHHKNPSPIFNGACEARNSTEDYYVQPFFSPAALFRCTYFRDPAIIADYYHPIEGNNQKAIRIGLTSEAQISNEHAIATMGQATLREIPHSSYYGRDFIWPWPLPSKSQVTRNLKRYRPAPRKYVCARCKTTTTLEQPVSQQPSKIGLASSDSRADPSSHSIQDAPTASLIYTRPITRSHNIPNRDGIKGVREEGQSTLNRSNTENGHRYFKCCPKARHPLKTTKNTLLPMTLNNLKTLSPKGKRGLRCGGRRKRRPWSHVSSSKQTIQTFQHPRDEDRIFVPEDLITTPLPPVTSSATKKGQNIVPLLPSDLRPSTPQPAPPLNAHKALPKIRLKLSKSENPTISSSSQGSIHPAPDTLSYEVSTLILPPSSASSPTAPRSSNAFGSPSTHNSRSRLKLLFSLKKPAGCELVPANTTNVATGDVTCKGRRGRPCSKLSKASERGEGEIVRKRRKKRHKSALLKKEPFDRLPKVDSVQIPPLPNGLSNNFGEKSSHDLTPNTYPVLTIKPDGGKRSEESSSSDEIEDKALVIDMGSDPEPNPNAKPIPEILTPKELLASRATKSLRIKIKPLENLHVGRLSSPLSSPAPNNEVPSQRPSVITRLRVGDEPIGKASPASAESESDASYKLSFTYLHPREITSPRVPEKCLRTGDIVWGKIQGYPWWPGRIMTFTVCINRLPQGEITPAAPPDSATPPPPKSITKCRPPAGKVVWQKCKVAWFGSNKTSEVSSHEIVPFSQFYDTHYNRRKRGTFQEAVQQAALAEASRINRDSRAPFDHDASAPL